MVPLIVVLLILFAALAVAGFLIKAFFWLAIIGIGLFIATALVAGARMRGGH